MEKLQQSTLKEVNAMLYKTNPTRIGLVKHSYWGIKA